MRLPADLLGVASRGASRLDPDAMESLRSFCESRIRPDGGFAGRHGQSDLYYTLFGVQLQLALGLHTTRQTRSFVQNISPSGVKDFTHLTVLARLYRLLDLNHDPNIIPLIEAFRSRDGGYNHTLRNAQSGTIYADFLAVLAYFALNSLPPEIQRLSACITQSLRHDGSFSNDPGDSPGSTSSTSAGLVLLHAMDSPACQLCAQKLLSRALPDGGFKPNDSVHLPDLLSTAAALYSLKNSSHDLSPIAAQQEHFIGSLWNDDGGFSGHPLEDVSDCEYSFYALLALGSLKS